MSMKELNGHWKKLVSDPKYLGEADLVGQPEIVATIASVTMEPVRTGTGNKTEDKTVLNFAEDIKPLVLNVTNAKTIQKLSGTPMVEQWAGTRIQIYYDPRIMFGRDQVGGVRVRPFAPKCPKCQVCNKDIRPFGNYKTAEMLAEYTKNKYGKEMCSDCATKKAKKGENA